MKLVNCTPHKVDIHAMAYELHRLELAIELGREVV